MSARAFATEVFERDMVRVQVGRTGSGGISQVFTWRDEIQNVTEPGVMPDPESGMWLPRDVARAVYEALADHFGHSGTDTRALRRDYEAERKRVDLLIGNLIGGVR